MCKEAFESIHTADKDEWAAGFMRVADHYFNEAKSLEKTDPTKANADYIRAWRFIPSDAGRFPRPPGSSARTKRRSRRFSLMRSSSIRRSKSCTFRSRAKRSSATCACRKMRKARCRW